MRKALSLFFLVGVMMFSTNSVFACRGEQHAQGCLFHTTPVVTEQKIDDGSRDIPEHREHEEYPDIYRSLVQVVLGGYIRFV